MTVLGYFPKIYHLQEAGQGDSLSGIYRAKENVTLACTYYRNIIIMNYGILPENFNLENEENMEPTVITYYWIR
jgi:hypothetical protein